MISVHEVSCWAHSTVSNYGCVPILTHKLGVSVALGPLVDFHPLCCCLHPSHSSRRSPGTSSNTEPTALSACWQGRSSWESLACTASAVPRHKKASQHFRLQLQVSPARRLRRLTQPGPGKQFFLSPDMRRAPGLPAMHK